MWENESLLSLPLLAFFSNFLQPLPSLPANRGLRWSDCLMEISSTKIQRVSHFYFGGYPQQNWKQRLEWLFAYPYYLLATAKSWKQLKYPLIGEWINRKQGIYRHTQRNICCSVAKSCLTLGNAMDCNTPAFPAIPYLLQLAQTHIHWISDAIQPAHPLLLPSIAINLSQHQDI